MSATDIVQYTQNAWGETVTGTKEALQALGIAEGLPFPGEEGGPKRQLNVQDPRGFKTTIKWRAEHDGGKFFAWISFPGRQQATQGPLQFAPGVSLLQQWWYDEYTGTADALVAAGLCRAGQFPGEPGMRKVRVTIFPDGTLPTGAPTANYRHGREPGAKSIRRSSARTFTVTVRIAEEEVERRRAAEQQRDAEWKARMDALPLPRPLMDLSARDAARREATIQLFESAVQSLKATNRARLSKVRPSHLQLVWSVPAQGVSHG